MAQWQRKAQVVEAELYDGPKLIVVSDEKGQQTATKGDYLVGSEPRKVTVVTAAKFEADFEPYVPPTPEDEQISILTDQVTALTEENAKLQAAVTDLSKQ
jgi:hypothetical protein